VSLAVAAVLPPPLISGVSCLVERRGLRTKQVESFRELHDVDVSQIGLQPVSLVLGSCL
jgi:hypothetical protein